MANIKKQFAELRKTTPKHVQWLLLIVAFIVVLILLTLLLHGDKKQDAKTIEFASATLTIEPDHLDWSNTKVGETKTQRFTLSSNVPVKIDAVRTLDQLPAGLSAQKNTCTNIGQINEGIPCWISIDYAPTAPADTVAVSLFVDWRGAGLPEKLNTTDKIVIALGAQAPPPPKPEPKPQIEQEIKEIASDNIFEEPVQVAPPEQKPEPTKPAARNVPIKTEACSDFAFPGYNSSGVQIGWIKPKQGQYLFHPFSDKNCDSPIGIYNPDNGIITDMNNPSKKIGTDAEHIGYGTISGGDMPVLSNPVEPRTVNKARQLSAEQLQGQTYGGHKRLSQMDPNFMPKSHSKMQPSSFGVESTTSSAPYDRTFVLRQYKPIPATIVSEIRAVAGETKLPVTATVDRNVYSDDGRTIIVPTGTMMLGFVSDRDMPGPYKSIGRVNIEWYRFIRPDGVEFNFTGNKPFSADAQGRTGVPGRGSTDYMEQFIMPMLTAVVPAAVNLIAPISDKFINQIDLDNNTVTQTGQVRSSELAKNEIISTWNKVAQKLLVDMMDNTVPPFSIASGSRITVFSPNDLIVTCGGDGSKHCAIAPYSTEYAPTGNQDRIATVGANDPSSLIGQVRSFNLDQYCNGTGGVSATPYTIQTAGLDYRTVVFYCQTNQYAAINNAKQAAVYQNQQQTGYAAQGMVQAAGNAPENKTVLGSKEYNEQVLGLEYNADGTIKNPFEKPPVLAAPVLTCEDGTAPDINGCCTGETYTDMGEQGFNCCPASGGDCFPPIL